MEPSKFVIAPSPDKSTAQLVDFSESFVRYGWTASRLYDENFSASQASPPFPETLSHHTDLLFELPYCITVITAIGLAVECGVVSLLALSVRA